MTIEEARESVMVALRNNGEKDVVALNAAIVSAQIAVFDSRARINVDFERRDGKIKISVYVLPDGFEKEDRLVAIGSLGALIKDASIEAGKDGLHRKTEGVLFKLNTGVSWESATPMEIARVAKIVAVFKDAVTAVF